MCGGVILPTPKERLTRESCQLIILPDGFPSAATFVPRVFQALTFNSFPTLRVMLYTDAIAHHGVNGIFVASGRASARSFIARLKYSGSGRLSATRAVAARPLKNAVTP
jgi:hypothetical protein